MEKKTLPQGIVNPFSDDFVAFWDEWKEYRWEEHRFKYKGVRSEQAALMVLNDESGKDEKEAIEIIKMSMANGWKGFFKRKKETNGSETIGRTATVVKLNTSDSKVNAVRNW